MSKFRVLFLTGTRADYSKLRPLIQSIDSTSGLEPVLFVTGMHMLKDYGLTHTEVETANAQTYKIFNQIPGDSDYVILAKTVLGLGDFITQNNIDLIVIHGDRIEALAGAQVGVMTSTLVAHIEGGELSGTVDDSYRHAISKLAQLHFVSNQEAKTRLMQLGEAEASIFVIGSPELDLMHSENLPSLDAVKERYGITFDAFGIAIFHPVVTEKEMSAVYAESFSSALKQSDLAWIVIESNNDQGSDGIRRIVRDLESNPNFKIFPSMRYEYFLTLLKHAILVAGNSSVGVRESPHYGVPSVNVGSRQNGRSTSSLVVHCSNQTDEILLGIREAMSLQRVPDQRFGDGMSAERFSRILQNKNIFSTSLQKAFHEIPKSYSAQASKTP